MPPSVVALGMCVGLIGDGGWLELCGTLAAAAALAGLFHLLFTPLLEPLRRYCHGLLFMPFSAVVCAFMVGWCLLCLCAPVAWTLKQTSGYCERPTLLLKSIDLVTVDLPIQAGLSWFLGILACLWARRRCGQCTTRSSVSIWRLVVGPLVIYPVVIFSGWLLHLWWVGGQLDPELLAFCRRGGDGDVVACQEFQRDICWSACKQYEADPSAPRPICPSAIGYMSRLPELLQWPRRAEVNARWDRYRKARR